MKIIISICIVAVSFGFYSNVNILHPIQDGRCVLVNPDSKYTVEGEKLKATIFICGFSKKEIESAQVIYRIANSKMDTVKMEWFSARIEVNSKKLGKNTLAGRVVINTENGLAQEFLFEEDFITLNRKDYNILNELIAKYQ